MQKENQSPFTKGAKRHFINKKTPGAAEILKLNETNLPIAIKKLRQNFDLNQVEFSKKIGFSQSYLAAVETFNRPVTDKLLEAIKNSFGVDITIRETTNPNWKFCPHCGKPLN